MEKSFVLERLHSRTAQTECGIEDNESNNFCEIII